jgi:6-phosphogluconate dehydrogenase (decarboxylating)
MGVYVFAWPDLRDVLSADRVDFDRDVVARMLVRLTVVADRLLDETATAVADRGSLPDWSERTPRNVALLGAHRAEVEASMPAWEPAPVQPRRRSLLDRLLGINR